MWEKITNEIQSENKRLVRIYLQLDKSIKYFAEIFYIQQKIDASLCKEEQKP